MNTREKNDLLKNARNADVLFFEELEKEIFTPFRHKHPNHPIFHTGSAPVSYRFNDCIATSINSKIVGVSGIK